LEITKTVLSLMLIVITILTTLTTTIAAAYAGGGDNDDGDGNKNKAEDDSAAAIADCDDNVVEEARFLCIALATNDVEIETPGEEPPGEGLVVCKEVVNPPQGVGPLDFELDLIDSSGSEFVIPGQPPPDCAPRISVSEGGIEEGMSPGAYTITERVLEDEPSEVPDPDSITVEGDCRLVDNDPPTATGEIQEGDSQICTFINTYEDDS
jgi:hypothetical protein